MPRTPSPIRLVAIDPGSRYIGMAVFEGTRLLDWRVKQLTANRRQASALLGEGRALIRSVITRYAPEILAIRQETPGRRRQGRAARMFARGLRVAGEQRGLRVYAYPSDRVRGFFCQGLRATRLEVARIIATQYYPFLYPHYEQELRKPWYREKYYLSMFCAVALGLYCLEQLGKRRRSAWSRGRVR